MDNFLLTKPQQELFDLIEQTKQNVFLQGQAGSGKSVFLQHVVAHSNKSCCVVCPTAVAAINVGGVTIHSLFQIPPRDFLIIDDLILKTKKDKEDAKSY